MKREFKNGDNLPCFRYILENIGDGNITTLASFTLSYIRYLQNVGITTPNEIVDALNKLSLTAQRSMVNRSTPLDFLTIKGTRYSIDSEELFDKYMNELLKACKDAPASFSMLYKKQDSRLSLCNLCPMSSQYSLSYAQKELLLSKYTFENVGNFNKIITCIGDIEALFHTYIDMYMVLNHITKAYAAPLYQLLFRSIYTNTTYFNPLFGTREYRAIRRPFIKALNAYGLTNRNKNFDPDFDMIIYEYLVAAMDEVVLIDTETALAYKQELMCREKYTPDFEVDAIPAVVPLTKTSNSKNTSKSRTSGISVDNNKKNTRKIRGNKVIDIYDMSTPLSDAFDVMSGITDMSTSVLDAPMLEEKVHSVVDDVVSVSLEKEDIVSSDGEIIVEHIVEEEGTLHYDEDEQFDDWADLEDEYEEDVENAASGNGVFYEDTVQKDMDDIELSKQQESSLLADADKLVLMNGNIASASVDVDDKNDTSVVGESDAITDDISSADIEMLDNETIQETSQSFEISMLLSSLCFNMKASDNIEEILYDNQYDRLISRISESTYIVMEPGQITIDEKSQDIILLYAGKEFCYVKPDSLYLQRLLDFHKYTAYSARLIRLYSLFEENNIVCKNKELFVPLIEILELLNQPDIFLLPVTEYLHFLWENITAYRLKVGGETTELACKYSLLYSAYGYSLRHNRFLNHSKDKTLCYNTDGSVTFFDYTYEAGTRGMAGTIFDFIFHLPSDKQESSFALSEDIILKMCKGAFFQKFNLQLFFLSEERIRIYADTYCSDYVCNYILMHFFKIGIRYGLKPLNITVEKRVIDSVNGLIIS